MLFLVSVSQLVSLVSQILTNADFVNMWIVEAFVFIGKESQPLLAIVRNFSERGLLAYDLSIFHYFMEKRFLF